MTSKQLYHVTTILLTLVVCVLSVKQDDFRIDPLPQNASFVAGSVTYDDGGMGPLNNFARSFINTALPGGFDEEFVKDIIDNGFPLDKIQELLKKFVGYVAAIAVGILFLIVFPIVGCCFGCCRICGNCGGKRIQKETEYLHVKRRVFTCVMLGITVFILVGNICTYVSNDRLSGALGEIGDNVADNLEDFDRFLTLLSRQINTIGVTNLEKTKQETLKYMKKDDLQKFVSEYILDTMSNGTLSSMEEHTNELGTIFDEIGNASTILKSEYQAMCTSPVICSGFPDPTATGPIADLLTNSKPQFDTFKNSKPTETAKQQIENKVKTSLPDMTSTRTSVNESFNKIGDQVKTVQDKINEFRNNTKSGFDVKSMTDKTRSAQDTAKKYDKYRKAAGASLAAMITIVAVLQFLGVGFGFFGQGTSTSPTERGCVSNSGGNMLIASVAFIFIFSWLLMLLTTLCFSLGALVERFICQPASNDELTLLKVTSDLIPGDIVGNDSFADIMLKCKSGKTVYEAFPIMKSKFNITEVQAKMDAEKLKMNKETEDSMKNIATSLSGTSFAASATANLNDLQQSLTTIDFAAIENQRSTLNSIPPQLNADRFKSAFGNMLDTVTKLQPFQSKVGDWSTEFQNGMTKAENDIKDSTKINVTVQQFIQRITDPVTLYVNTTKTDVETRMGDCSPLWNMYNSIVIISLCKYTIDAFNGFWFSIGWCLFFFVPGVIIAVKLAKYFRRMDSEEDYEGNIGMQDIKSNQIAPAS